MGTHNLRGFTILVVEDDYLLAMTLDRTLRQAGGSVLGPVGNEADALTLLSRRAPTCAVVDINLGRGVRFSVAEHLQDGGIPFLFVTGYDDTVIPPRFSSVERLRKPVEAEQLLQVTFQMCSKHD